jgi:hypothetical protein
MSIGLTVFTRDGADDPRTATTLTAGETLQMPEIGIEIPIDELYEDTDVPRATDDAPARLNDTADGATETA